MTRHIITVEEIQEYLSVEDWDPVARSGGDGSDKRMEVNTQTRAFRVSDHGKVVFLGLDLHRAVQAYNDAP